MRAARPTLLRGLFAGLLALVVFASLAVAMTAGGPAAGTSSLAQGAAGQRFDDDDTEPPRLARLVPAGARVAR